VARGRLEELATLSRRLQAEYESLFDDSGAHVVIGATPSAISAEVLWGGSIGPALYKTLHLLQRRPQFIGRLAQVRSIDQIEVEMRSVLNSWLAERPWAKHKHRNDDFNERT
jgi:hypothetical protein